MKFNYVTNNLALLGCSITDLSIKNYIASIPEDVEKNLGFDIVPVEISEDEDNRYGRIVLKIVIILQSATETVCKIEMQMEGRFSSPIRVKESDFNKLLLVNGATALYAIARGKIENISAAIFANGKITIPFVNILDFYKEKNKDSDAK